MNHSHSTLRLAICLAWLAASASMAQAQSVCLPAPRLLTVTPMGGRAGETVEVKITGQHLEQVDQLLFSHPGLTAKPKVDANNQPIDSIFEVTIAADCPVGVHEARVMSRLGVSTSRVFCVGSLPELLQQGPCASVDQAMEVQVDSVCNGVLAARAVNHYRFHAHQGQRIAVDCSARGIDSKMKPVVIVADASGADLQVDRRGGAIDFRAPETGDYLVKLHDLTFQGGSEYFFRLRLEELAEGQPLVRSPRTRSVNMASWPPASLVAEDGSATAATMEEVEPNDGRDGKSQQVALPLDIAGAFYPAADVDVYQFSAKKGETWWVEVASERLGRPTDPTVLVQRQVDGKWEDVAELSDIPSPLKRSSNGYSYDGPPYNAGSADVLGSFTAPEDGTYQLRVSDLFGGTRSDPNNVYRLIVRQAEPDFALVAWALHMNLRNGDRNALSKPMALRGGASMAMEVVAVRRDGFNGPIHLALENLPEGVTGTGFTIPAGQTRGIAMITAEQNAPRNFAFADFSGVATINGETVTRRCYLASMAWPVPNAWSEIPSPRLVVDAPVSVGGSEYAAVTLTAGGTPWEGKVGQPLKVKLDHVRRGEFSGTAMQLRAFGPEFAAVPAFDVSLDADSSEVELDLAKLKLEPGEYTLAFYGRAVAKYQYNPDGVVLAASDHQQAEQKLSDFLAADSPSLEQKKVLEAELAAAKARHDAAVKLAKPKDIVDIYVSEPIQIRVLPADEKP